MSVVLEKNKIVITIPTNDPEGELHNIQKNMLDIMSDLHPDFNGDTYWAYLLIKSMIPDKHTFELTKDDFQFDVNPLKQTISSFSPQAMLCYLTKAQTFLWKAGSAGNGRNIELEDTIGHVKSITEAIEKGMKKEPV